MIIDARDLRRFAPHCPNPEEHTEALNDALQLSSITTGQRLAHLLGQIYVETAGFTRLVESMAYRSAQRLDAVFRAVRGVDDARALIDAGPAAIANRVYARRLGNGDEASGDGWAFRGRGYLMHSGRHAYLELATELDTPLLERPDLLAEPRLAAAAAVHFWAEHGLSALADTEDVATITRRINGPARLGLNERRHATARALAIWES